MKKILLLITFILVMSASHLLAQEVSAEGYELGIMIAFKDNVSNQQVKSLVSKYSQYNLKLVKKVESSYNDLRWYCYTDAIFQNKELLHNIRNEDIVQTAFFTITQYEQKAYAEKVQYQSPILWVFFNENVSNEEINLLIERYTIFGIRINTSFRGAFGEVRLFNFDTFMADNETILGMMNAENTVESAFYQEDMEVSIDSVSSSEL